MKPAGKVLATKRPRTSTGQFARPEIEEEPDTDLSADGNSEGDVFDYAKQLEDAGPGWTPVGTMGKGLILQGDATTILNSIAARHDQAKQKKAPTPISSRQSAKPDTPDSGKTTPKKNNSNRADTSADDTPEKSTNRKKAPEWKKPNSGWGQDPDPAHRKILVGDYEHEVWTTEYGVHDRWDDIALDNDRPVFTKWNMAKQNWEDDTWLPPPGVLLDETMIWVVTMMTLGKRSHRCYFWPAHFNPSGDLRRKRVPIGNAPIVVAVHEWNSTGDFYSETAVGRFYLVYGRRERLGGVQSPAPMTDTGPQEAASLAQKDGSFLPWTFGTEEAKVWAVDDFFIKVNQKGKVDLPWACSFHNALLKENRKLTVCIDPLINARMKKGPEIDSLEMADDLAPRNCTGNEAATDHAKGRASLTRTHLSRDWASDLPPRSLEDFVSDLVESVEYADRLKADPETAPGGYSADIVQHFIREGANAEELLGLLKPDLAPDSVYQRFKQGYYTQAQKSARTVARSEEAEREEAEKAKALSLATTATLALPSRDSLPPTNQEDRNSSTGILIAHSTGKRKASGLVQAQQPLSKKTRQKDSARQSSVASSVGNPDIITTDRNYVGKIIYHNMMDTIREAQSRQVMESAELGYLRRSRNALDLEIERAAADLALKRKELVRLNTLIGVKMEAQSYPKEEFRLQRTLTLLETAKLPVLVKRLSADSKDLMADAEKYVLQDRRKGRNCSPGLKTMPWSDEEDSEEDVHQGDQASDPIEVPDEAEDYGDMGL